MGCVRDRGLEFRCAPGPISEQSRAGEGLLPVGCHDRRLGRPTQGRVTQTTPMFIDEARSAFRIAPGAPRARLDQNLDPARWRYAKKPETQQPAKLAHTRIALAAGPRRAADGKPDFIAGCCAIDPLKDEFEIEAKLQLANDDKRRFVAPQRHQIATADFPLHVEAETLEKALHGHVKRGLSVVGLQACDLLRRHRCTDGTVIERTGSLFVVWTVAPTR